MVIKEILDIYNQDSNINQLKNRKFKNKNKNLKKKSCINNNIQILLIVQIIVNNQIRLNNNQFLLIKIKTNC